MRFCNRTSLASQHLPRLRWDMLEQTHVTYSFQNLNNFIAHSREERFSPLNESMSKTLGMETSLIRTSTRHKELIAHLFPAVEACHVISGAAKWRANMRAYKGQKYRELSRGTSQRQKTTNSVILSASAHPTASRLHLEIASQRLSSFRPAAQMHAKKRSHRRLRPLISNRTPDPEGQSPATVCPKSKTAELNRLLSMESSSRESWQEPIYWEGPNCSLNGRPE